MNRKKIIVLSCLSAVIIAILVISTSYALFRFNITENVDFKLFIGSLELTIEDTNTEDRFVLSNAVPMKDDMALEKDGYTFTLTNTGTIDSYYYIYLDDILLNDEGERLDNSYVKVNIMSSDTGYNKTITYSDLNGDASLINGYLKVGESINYTLRMWLKYEAGNEAQNKYFATQIRVIGMQQDNFTYTETILNGTDPVITNNLVPVVISATGKVTKADITSKWYSYEEKNWANAVILKDESISYSNNQEIPEDNIESYFVWIPRYKYQIFNDSNYTGITSISNSVQTINVVFENKDVEPSTGSTVGSYLTHPAFTSFDVNGIWVGKFETGYDGATTITDAQVNSVDTSKIIIKPNVYSWRNITVGNAFKNSYDYNRSLDSHMMKNTEWGAVAYLQHSKYGSQTSVRINNNRNYITGYSATEEPTLGYNNGTSIEGNRIEETTLGVDGTYTVNYLNTSSTVSSTTGNYSGIYDMSGGAWEYVMGYTTGATTVGGSSEITSLYPDFYNDSNYTKYWDKYTSTINTNYNNQILGDATGEMGPFGSQIDSDNNTRYKSSWYGDYAHFASSSYPWFVRGGSFNDGTLTGTFAFSNRLGDKELYVAYRIVLVPSK